MKIIGVTMNENTIGIDKFYAINGILVENFAKIFKKYNIAIVFLPHRMEDPIEDYCKMCDGVILSGNRGHIDPKIYGQALHESVKNEDICHSRYNFESKIAKHFIENDKPILGICGGMQVINVALGGTLYQNILKQIPDSKDHRSKLNDIHRWEHEIKIEELTLLSKISTKNTAKVNTSHAQAVDRLGQDLVVSAFSKEDGIIEAIEVRGKKFALGVQWHPEFDISRLDEDIFEYFARSVAF